MAVAAEPVASIWVAEDTDDAASAACRTTNGLALAPPRSARIVKGIMAV